jgi:putative sigma-54 modulation protein
MQYIIQSPHKKISAKVHRMVKGKFERFEKLFDRLEQCHIVLRKEKNGQQQNYLVEAKLALPGNDLFAREQAESFEVAAEKVCIDLENQIKKHKSKVRDRRTVLPIDKFVSDEELE